jgi:hypothetical protein
MRHSSSAVYHREVSEPPEPKRRLAKLPPAIAAKLEANQTVELDTADFDELGQTGVIAERPNATVALTRTDLEEVDPKIAEHDPGAEPKVVVALEGAPNTDQTLAELPAQRLGELAAQRDVRTQFVNRVSAEKMMTLSPPGRQRALIIAIYVIVGTVLAISIYYRFG